MPADDPPDPLTDRQAEVLQEIRDRAGDYVSTGILGDELGVTEDTAYDHVCAIRNKGYPLEFDRAQVGWHLADRDDDADGDAEGTDAEDTPDADTTTTATQTTRPTTTTTTHCRT